MLKEEDIEFLESELRDVYNQYTARQEKKKLLKSLKVKAEYLNEEIEKLEKEVNNFIDDSSLVKKVFVDFVVKRYEKENSLQEK